MQKSESINELAKALSAFQGDVKNVKKDAENPFFKSNYADLPSVLDMCRPLLAKHSLALFQALDGEEFVTLLMHSSGQFIQISEAFRPAKNEPQCVGSLKTYIRRYSAMSVLGIAGSDDDDAESAMVREVTKHAPITSSFQPNFETCPNCNSISLTASKYGGKYCKACRYKTPYKTP